MDYETIINNINSGAYNNKMKYPMDAFLSENYIFDENLSVKENRKMVEDHNQKIKDEKQKYRNETIRITDKFHKDVVDYLIQNFKLNKAQAELILSNAYADGHSDGYYEVFHNADTMADRYIDIFNLGLLV